MLGRSDLRKIARARLKDAQALFANRRYDGAVYLCGYSVEVGLKARICRTLKWAGFPETRSEFQDLTSFKTHDLATLLHLSGIEAKIKSAHLAAWSAVASWDPEARYYPVGKATKSDASLMISSAQSLLAVL